MFSRFVHTQWGCYINVTKSLIFIISNAIFICQPVLNISKYEELVKSQNMTFYGRFKF